MGVVASYQIQLRWVLLTGLRSAYMCVCVSKELCAAFNIVIKYIRNSIRSVIYPINLVKTRLQAGTHAYKGMFGKLMMIFVHSVLSLSLSLIRFFSLSLSVYLCVCVCFCNDVYSHGHFFFSDT